MKTGQTRQISRASLEESTQRALTTHQDVKIPDGPIVIDKDLLQEIRNLITLCTLIDKSGCIE
jgi:DNA helicase TIP49 (TBP-interacting protein)